MAKGVPAFISYTVLVHAGSYKDFLTKLTKEYPDLQIRFCKRMAVHYYILQLEDHSEKGIDKQKIYNLPLMGLREEFSSYIFFKNIKSYNNVLKRMCNAKENDNAPYILVQHMMTPFEKSRILNLEEAKSLEIKELTTDKLSKTITYCSHDKIMSAEVLNKLFSLDKVSVDDKEKEFVDLVKDLTWQIGIH